MKTVSAASFAIDGRRFRDRCVELVSLWELGSETVSRPLSLLLLLAFLFVRQTVLFFMLSCWYGILIY